jgi:hypothetical protein
VTDIEAYTDADLAYKLVMLRKLADMVLEELDRTKQVAALQYPKGASIPARTCDDIKLGKVSKTDPKPVAKVVDKAALEEWLRAEYPDKLDTRIELADMGELLAFLTDSGRTDLFTEVQVVPEHLLKQAEALAVRGRPIPGIEVRRPAGVLQVRTEIAAEYVVRHMLADSPVPLLGIEA